MAANRQKPHGLKERKRKGHTERCRLRWKEQTAVSVILGLGWKPGSLSVVQEVPEQDGLLHSALSLPSLKDWEQEVIPLFVQDESR